MNETQKSISIIIPVYNESPGISVFAELIKPLEKQCEIIFIDGGSSDDTMARLKQSGAEVLSSPKKGRANQMNLGASVSSGEILWFLHADSIPPPEAPAQIREVIERGYKIGCFRLRFDTKSPIMHLTALLSNQLRVKIRNIAFGDQGLFIHRDLFESIGGYAAIPLMEDYQLSLDITKAGYRLGLAKGKIITSQRRYLKGGRLKTILTMWSLQHKFRRGEDITAIAKEYNK